MKAKCKTKTAPMKPERKNEIVVYQPDEVMRIDVRLEDQTVWLNQAQLSELFGVTVPTVNYHIKEIFATGELQAGATIRKILIVRKEGARQVQRLVDFYNLDKDLGKQCFCAMKVEGADIAALRALT